MTETIGERIKNLRLIRGYTQEELAERLYMRKSTISAYENNTIDIKVSVLMEIAKALNTSPSFFLINKEIPEQLKVDEAIAIINELYIFVQKSIGNGQSTGFGERQLNYRQLNCK